VSGYEHKKIRNCRTAEDPKGKTVVAMNGCDKSEFAESWQLLEAIDDEAVTRQCRVAVEI
jgi:hypothetical protein